MAPASTRIALLPRTGGAYVPSAAFRQEVGGGGSCRQCCRAGDDAAAISHSRLCAILPVPIDDRLPGPPGDKAAPSNEVLPQPVARFS